MANDDVLWKKVDAIRRRPAASAPATPGVQMKSPARPRRAVSSVAKAVSDPSSETKPSLRRDTMAPSNQAGMPPRHHDTVPPDVVETIRKAVKQIGKEAATHRFTREEKRAIADIVYTYVRRGYRCTENEITRIAVNWLLHDYSNNGAESILHKVLAALNA